MPGWYSLPHRLAPALLSLAIHNPLKAMTRSSAPAPRDRVGFQAVARPVVGSSPEIPGRDTAPGPALSQPFSLLNQRW